MKSIPYIGYCAFEYTHEDCEMKLELNDKSYVCTDEDNHFPKELKSATYTRELAEDKTVTFVLPFDIPVEHLNGKVYELSGFDGKTLNFTAPVDGIAHAHTPYLLTNTKAGNLMKEAIADYTYSAIDEENLGKMVDNAALMMGTYTELTELFSTDEISIYGYSGGQFVRQKSEEEGATKGATLNPFRAMIGVIHSGYTEEGNQGVTSAAQSRLAIAFGEEVTGVISLDDDELNSRPVTVYDLNGRPVRTDADPLTCLQGLPKGTYIVDGKRVMK